MSGGVEELLLQEAPRNREMDEISGTRGNLGSNLEGRDSRTSSRTDQLADGHCGH